MFDLKRAITLINPRRGGEAFDPSVIKEIYLISVLAGGKERFRSITKPIKNNTVHVFDGTFAEIVLNELDTVSDFVDYLRAKEDLFGKLEKLTIIGGEEELLAHYLMYGHSFEELSKFTHVVMDGESWTQFQQKAEYQAKKKADEVSYGWDSIIETIHSSGSKEYEPVARELARLNRFQRRCLSKAFLEAHVKVHNDSVHNSFRRVLVSDERTYCFLFMDDPEPRSRRKAVLEHLCYVARGKHKQNTTVVGIATEQQLRPTCSYDFCLLEQPDWSAEDDKRVDEIQKRPGLLTNAVSGRAEEHEYPRNNKEQLLRHT